MSTTQPTTKKWYQSKIVLFALSLVIVAGGNLAFGWISGEITPEQLQAIQTAYPAAVEVVERLKQGESILSLLGVIVGIVITVSRVWFTTSIIPQSLRPKK